MPGKRQRNGIGHCVFVRVFVLETTGSIRVPKARGGDRRDAGMTGTGWLEPEIALERKIIHIVEVEKIFDNLIRLFFSMKNYFNNLPICIYGSIYKYPEKEKFNQRYIRIGIGIVPIFFIMRRCNKLISEFIDDS